MILVGMDTKIKTLNLYAGIGGNRKLWPENFDVTAVESEEYIAEAYSKMYPRDTVIVGDAHAYLLKHFKEYEFIWSSPPCPTHSRLVIPNAARFGNYSYPDMKLYEEIILLNTFFEGSWVIENVTSYYKPLVTPTAVVDRHYIWSSGDINDRQFERLYTGSVDKVEKEKLAAGYRIWLPRGTRNQQRLLRNAVDPRFGKYIVEQLGLV